MAEAPDVTEFEGKQMASQFDICGGCETNIAVTLCEECPVKLCTTCAKSHQKLKYTKHHVLVDIGCTDAVESRINSGGKGPCSRHNGEVYTHMCRQCVDLLCDSCKPDHKDHTLQPLNDDVKLYQAVCGKHIQHLIDDLRELEEMKTVVESHITTYEEAIGVVNRWEENLIKMVKKKAEKLKKQVKELKDEKYKALSDKVSCLTTKLQELDLAMAKLNIIRKSMDFGILAKELSDSRALLDRVGCYKSKLQPLPQAVSVTDVLPNGDRIKDLEDGLDIMFTKQDIGEDTCRKEPPVAAAWKFTSSNCGKDVSLGGENPVVMKNVLYGLGPRGEINGAVCFPAANTDQSIAVMNPTGRLRFCKTMTFFTEVFVTGSARGPLFEYRNDDFTGSYFWIHPNSTSLHVDHTGFSVYASNVLTLNTWHRIAAVWDISSVSLYVDGKLVKSQQGKVDLSLTQKGNLYIGCWSGDNRRIKGRLASVRIYNVALSEKHIQDL